MSNTSFAHSLFAMTVELGRYAVQSQITAGLATDRMTGMFRDVSMQPGYYIDKAAILHKRELAAYLYPDSSVAKWYAELPAEVSFIVVHIWEFDNESVEV